MFTGLIEEVAAVTDTSFRGEIKRIELAAHKIVTDMRLGDSIAVNGVCLTVVSFGDTTFAVEAVPETLARTTLRNLKAGDRVNVERALALGARMGGHWVQGHVDTTARITHIEKFPSCQNMTFVCPEDTSLRYVVMKGSITIDGVSLTVASVTADSFTIALIPHTLEHTHFHMKHVGDLVNIEWDLMAKYVEKWLQPYGRDEVQQDGHVRNSDKI